jgi:hypothetical protein
MATLSDYLRHLPECNLNQQNGWDIAQAAVNDCPPDEGTSIATHEIAQKRTQCTCGMAELEQTIAAAPAMLAALHFVKDFFLNLENGLPADDPLVQLRKRYHKPIHDVLDGAIEQAERKGA